MDSLGVSPLTLANGDQFMAQHEELLVRPMMEAAQEFLEEVDATVTIALGTKHLIECGYDPQAALIINILIVRHAQALKELEELRPALLGGENAQGSTPERDSSGPSDSGTGQTD